MFSTENYGLPQPNSEALSVKYFELLSQLQRNPIDYSKAFLAIAEEIKCKKNEQWNVPSFEDLKEDFGSFLHNKKSNTETILKYWNKHHLTVLIFLLAYFKDLYSIFPSQYEDQHWNHLSEYLPHTTPESLRYKWLSLQHKSSSYPNFWTLKDDYVLMEIVYAKAPVLLDPTKCLKVKVKWSMIAMHFNFQRKNNKLGKHCKERWFNHLSPLLNKAVWTDQEDILLLEDAIIHNKKWARIAFDFPGRTQHNVKNRFLSLIAREHKISSKKLSFKESCSKSLILKTLCNLKKRFNFASENPVNMQEIIDVKDDHANMENIMENPPNPLLMLNNLRSSEDLRKKDNIFGQDSVPLGFEKWEKSPEEECLSKKEDRNDTTREHDFLIENMEFFNI